MTSPSTVKPLYIFDIDGTLSDATHRLPYLEKDDYLSFYDACDKDKPIKPTLETLRLLITGGAEVWFFTGGSDRVLNKTMDWLHTHTGIDKSRLVLATTMRVDGDHTEDYVLKSKWYHGMLKCDQKRLVAVYEDRASVVSMWRNLGITCYQVAKGDF